MSVLEKVATDIASARGGIRAALAFVAKIDTEADAQEAYDRTKLAREWAKIRKVHKQVATDLLRLEIHCLRKIAQLGSLSVLPASYRPAANYFSHQTDEQIETLIDLYGEDAGPVAVYRRQALANEFEDSLERHRGLSGGYTTASPDEYDDEAILAAATAYRHDVQGALAAILERYEEEDEEFSIYDLGEQLFASIGVDEKSAAWGAKQGMYEVCRKAVRDAPTVKIRGTSAPKFITCHRRDGGETDFIRVPFHVATLAQLQDMVYLRRDQAVAAKAVADQLEMLANSLAECLSAADGTAGENSITLGELAARMAFAPREAA